MPEKKIPRRRRPPATRNCTKPPNPFSPRRRRHHPSPPPLHKLSRSASEPIILLQTTLTEVDPLVQLPKQGNQISSSFTCVESVSSSSPSLPGLNSFDGYSTDAKVVVSVTVEGSTGPVRAMVKLGSTVEDTIKLVVNKYSEEGRTPKLHHREGPDHRGHPSSSYELHHSHFSLRCLEKSELIGEVGSRSFYLRRSGSPEAMVVPAAGMFPLQCFFAGKFSKVVRRTRKLWNMLVCLP